jgi:hypothetical protein
MCSPLRQGHDAVLLAAWVQVEQPGVDVDLQIFFQFGFVSYFSISIDDLSLRAAQPMHQTTDFRPMEPTREPTIGMTTESSQKGEGRGSNWKNQRGARSPAAFPASEV